jgi:hypothetical protein
VGRLLKSSRIRSIREGAQALPVPFHLLDDVLLRREVNIRAVSTPLRIANYLLTTQGLC